MNADELAAVREFEFEELDGRRCERGKRIGDHHVPFPVGGTCRAVRCDVVRLRPLLGGRRRGDRGFRLRVTEPLCKRGRRRGGR